MVGRYSLDAALLLAEVEEAEAISWELEKVLFKSLVLCFCLKFIYSNLEFN